MARTERFVTIGVDAEPDTGLPEGVLDLVASATERAHLGQLAAGEPGVAWDRLLLSAQESFYKAWFPLTGRWLDFDQADVVIDPTAQTFQAIFSGNRSAHLARAA